MNLTHYHSTYFAHELTKRQPSGSIEKLGTSLFNATVDLNPHQLDAALFAFKSPLSRGAILADEVGLGKTIEAGLVISQLWAERKRRILVIAPTILRKQWALELEEKFFISSVVLDTREYNRRARDGSPLEPRDTVVICSYQFARARERGITSVQWDLVVIDEAHRLRNVWKSSNKIARSIKASVSCRPLVLLTATPLQNSLLELYGLVSFLDEHLFGDIEAFRARYMRGPLEERDMVDLRRRLRPVCQRTLRRQVQEYVRFTSRISITQDFTPTAAEQQLYDRVSDYLHRDDLLALPASQRQLITLVLRKLLASSSFAIAATFKAMGKRLADGSPTVAAILADEYETVDEEDEEWSEEASESLTTVKLSSEDAKVLDEARELINVSSLAESITDNAKGAALLSALEHGFKKLAELGAARKAVIFTESRRTQVYLAELLANNGYDGRTLTINGANTDDRSGAIYKDWITRHTGESVVTGNKSVDLRAAIVEHFRERADILIATEAASEGVNLQFCSLVVNYDLPWNPQRIEQRIGRCHRYGQKHDVVVINFLNRENAADERVFELLDQKFRLFDGVFGASDEVLGALESGVDFEKRIASIYQNCRTKAQIDDAFTQLRLDLDEEITERFEDTNRKLLENFDEEVAAKLRDGQTKMRNRLQHLESCLWRLTELELGDRAEFDSERYRFTITSAPDGLETALPGRYGLLLRDQSGDAYPYRPGSLLAEALIDRAKNRVLPTAVLEFDYGTFDGKVGILEPYIGQAGWLSLSLMTITALDEEDHLVWSVITDDGVPLHPDIGERLFRLPATVTHLIDLPSSIEDVLMQQGQRLRNEILEDADKANNRFYEEEVEKLDRWADDRKHGLEVAIKDIDGQIRQAKKDANLSRDLAAKIESQRTIRALEAERMKRRKELFDSQDEIDIQRDELISKVEARLTQSVDSRTLFSLQWKVIDTSA
jgi:adenine-specific DNA-methyltransferase